MKKLICLMLCFVLGLTFCACAQPQGKDHNISIVCASFAEYDWVKNLTQGTSAKVTILADTGTDMHSYQPTAADVLAIGKADLVVYNGGTADGWMTSAVKNSGFEGKSVRLMDVLGDRLLHLSADHQDEHHHGETCEYDEHTWLSLKNAVIACQKISKALISVDAANERAYTQNCTDYVQKLKQLDADYTDLVAKAKTKSVVIADRFPFVYLLSDYGLKWQAAYEGCSSETDADFEKVLSLAKWVDKEGISTLFIIEGGTDNLAKTVVSNTKGKNQQILTLDSMQSVTKKDIDGGKTYLSAMAQNLDNLKIALN